MKLTCYTIILILVSELSYANSEQGECKHEDCRSYSGKIKLINNTGHDGIFSVWGDKCLELRVKETINKVSKERDPDGENDLTYQTAVISSGESQS